MSTVNWRARLAGAMVVAAAVLCASAAQAGPAERDWPMFRHDEKHTGRTSLPGPPAAEIGLPNRPALRWFQGGVFVPEETGHRPPGPQGEIWSSPAEATDGTGARKVWYFHEAQWTLNGTAIGLRQLRSEAPLTTLMQSLPAPGSAIGPGATVSGEFATSAAINFASVADAGRRNNLNIRNLDPSRDDGVIPASTADNPWRFSFVATADASCAVEIVFDVEAFPQGLPALRQPLFSTRPLRLVEGRRRYEVTHQREAIDLGTLFPGFLGQQVGIVVRVELRNTSGASRQAYFEYDGASRSRIVTPILEPAVWVGCSDGSLYVANASTGNVMWSYWTGWGAAASQVRSSPVVDDEGVCYFGVEQSPGGGEGFTLGRAFAVRNDGSLRWVYPSSRRTYFLRSTADPHDPAGRRRLMSTGPGSTRDTSTFAQTGRSLEFTQFRPGATSTPRREETFVDLNDNGCRDEGEPFTDRNGNGIYDPPRPEALTQYGWIANVNLTGQVMVGGRFKIDLGYQANGTGNPPSALLWYRISKVSVSIDPASGSGDVQYGQELIGWTSAGQDQILDPDEAVPVGSSRFQMKTILTEPVDEAMFFSGEPFTDSNSNWRYDAGEPFNDLDGDGRYDSPEYIFLELGIEQVVAPEGTSGWRLVVEHAVDGTRITTAMISQQPIGAVSSSPVLSDADVLYFGDIDGRVYALDTDAVDDLEAGSLDEPWGPLSLGSGREIEFSSPALDSTVGRNRLYIGTGTPDPGASRTSGGAVFAIDLANWSVLWRFPGTGSIGQVLSSPAVADNGDIYVGSDDGHLYAIRADGTLRWQYPDPTRPGDRLDPLGEVRSSPAISRNGRVIYFGSYDNPDTPSNEAGMHAVRVFSTGEFAGYLGWVEGAGVRSSPAVSTGGLRRQLFFRSDSEFHAAVPAPDRYRLGQVGSGAQCVNLEKELAALPPRGSPYPTPQRGWLSDPLADGDRLESGTWRFSIQHASDEEVPRALRYRVSVAVTDASGSVVHRRLLTGGTGGWAAAPQALQPGVYYFHHEAAGSLLRGALPDMPEQFLSGEPGGGSIVLGEFATLEGEPGATRICEGQWRFVFTASANVAGAATISFDVYRVESGGARFLLFSTPASPPLSTVDTEYVITATPPVRIGLDSSDRLVVAVRASGTSTVVFRYEGDTNTRLIAPIPGVMQFAADLPGTTFQAGERLYVELAVPSSDPGTWYLTDWRQSYVRTAPFVVEGEAVFYGTNDGLVRAAQMGFDSGGSPTGWEPTLEWEWPPTPRRAYVSSPAIGHAVTPVVPGGSGDGTADPALYIGGGDHILVCLGPVGTLAPGYLYLPELPAPEGQLLRITKSVDKTTANTNDKVTFTMRVFNPSLPDAVLTALGVTLTDVLPGGLCFESASGAPTQLPGEPYTDLDGDGCWDPGEPYTDANGNGEYDGDTLIWDLEDIAPEDSETRTFTVKVTGTGIDPDPTPPGPRVEVNNTDFPDFVVASGDADGDYMPGEPFTDTNGNGEYDPGEPFDDLNGNGVYDSGLGDRSMRWGDYLFVRVTGRGQPTDIQNQARADWVYGTAASYALSNTATLSVGWGHRYQLTFEYDPANDPVLGVRPENQIPGGPTLSFQVRMELAASSERTGRAEEAYEATGTGPGGRGANSQRYVTVFKVHIAPRAYPYGPGAASVAQQPNRPWTPYFWKVFVQQSSGAAGEWGPLWGRNDDPRVARNVAPDPANRAWPQPFDMRIANPLQTDVPAVALGSANPGAATAAASIALTNRSRFGLVGTGTAARNVVRRAAVDLGQSTGLFDPSLFPAVPYDSRRENYLPAHSIRFAAPDFTSLGSGQTRGLALYAEVPRYQYRGDYYAPAALAPTGPLLLYVDLNGNGSWDPGEAYHEQHNDDWTGTYEPLEFAVGVANQPLMRMASETLDMGRAAVGKNYATLLYDDQMRLFRLRGAVELNIENVGNIPLVNSLATSSDLRPMEARSDLLSIPGNLVEFRREDDGPAGIPPYMPGNPMLLAKTPAGSALPLTFTARATVGLREPTTHPSRQEALIVIPADQPAGFYTGTVTTAESGAAGSGASAAVSLQIVESRETSELGSDIAPAAGFYGPDAVNLFWSSNRKSDGSLPGVADPMHLYYMTLLRDVQNFSYTRSAVFGPYPYAASDPMLLPDPGTWLRHSGAGYIGDDASGTQLLAWAGSTLRGSAGQPRYDNRLLWREWPAGEPFTDWNGNGTWDPGEPYTDVNGNGVWDAAPTAYDRIYDEPPVALRSEPSLMDGVFKSRPRFAKLETQGEPYSDLNFNNQWDTNEPFTDLNLNGRWDGGSLSQRAWLVWGEGQPQPWQMVFMELARYRAAEGQAWSEWQVVRKDVLRTPPALAEASDPSGFTYPQGNPNDDGLLHVAFAGRSYLRGNSDIYYGRYLTRAEPFTDTNANGRYDRGEPFNDMDRDGIYDDDPLGDDSTGGLVPFPRVTGEVAEPLTSRSFAMRHIEWVTFTGFWPRIYVDNDAGAPVEIYDPAVTPPQFDEGTGRYVIANASYFRADGSGPVTGKVEFDAGAGAIYFPDAPGRVTVDYTPRVMRLTKHPGSDVMPSAFIETYRELDENDAPRPAGFIPRLWVFWVRSGAVGLGPRLVFNTFRLFPDPQVDGNAGWIEEIRSNHAQWASLWAPFNPDPARVRVWTVDGGERAVQVDHPVNEFGMAAVKDPRYAQVWLVWSSTRSVPGGTQTDPVTQSVYTHNADIYYEPFSPALPE